MRQFQKHRSDTVATEQRWCRHAQTTARLALACVECCSCRVKLSESTHAALVVGLTVLGQIQMAGGPVKQPRAQSVLQSSDALADGGAR